MDPVAVEAFETKVLKQPEVFFTPSEEVASDIKSFTKHVFDHCTAFVSKASVTPLDQLYVEGFDADQIWEQLQLQNGPLVNELAKRIRGFNKQPESIRLFPVEKDDEEEDDEEDEEDAEKDEDDEQDHDDDDATVNSSDEDEKDTLSGSDDDSDAEKKPAPKQKKKKATKPKRERDVAEDGFFDWDEMDKAAEEEEEDEEDDIDLNDDLDDDDDDDDDEQDDFDEEDDDDDMEEGSDEEDAKDMKYEDFFDGPGGENGDEEEEEDDDEEADENDDDEEDLPRVDRAQFDEDAGDEDDMAERGILSSHQRQQLRLKKEITELEKEALGEKPWLLKGEVRSSARPENSLLEAILDYDRPGKVAPVITVEVSVALEDMIKKRILEDDFDDVIRKFAGNEQDEKKKLEDVSMEKSKEGLGEIYEKEYMKSAMGFEMDDESKQDQEEIDVMFKSLCWKLDALSNYQFTPKPMVKELQVKPSVPAIAMEEVVPISVSDANLKAPEEIYEKKRKRGEAVLQSKEEMSQEQRKALRNAKKQTRRKENKQKEADERLVAKLNPGLGNKYAKKKLMESISNAKNVTTGKAIEGSTKQFSNSKEFFTRLQEEVKDQIQKKAKTNEA